MTHTRRNAFFVLVLAGAWLALTCAASLHHCPDEESGGHTRTCEFYGHSIQVQAHADAGVSAARAGWDEIPAALFAAIETAAPVNPFDRSCAYERAPPV